MENTQIRRIRTRLTAAALAAVAFSSISVGAQAQVPAAPSPRAVASPSPAAGEQTPAPDVQAVAREAAKKVAPVGIPLQTTEQSELKTTTAMVSGPAVRVVGGKVSSGDPEKEAAAVESMAQLIRQLNIVRPQVAIGNREVDESTPTQRFDEKQVRALLGDSPTVVYQVVYRNTPIPDPMIVPWIRNIAVLKERYDEAIELLAKGRVTQGREALVSIVNEFPGTDYAGQASALIRKIDELQTPEGIKTVVATPASGGPDIVVDPNLSIGSVLFNPGNPAESRVMISGRSYGVGDNPRGIPGHRIVGVTDNTVDIEVERQGIKKRFTLKVGGQGGKR
jgi:hypothetical protein